VSRQVYFSIFLGWIEEIDVESPIFHEAVWRWYASTHPSDRYNDRAVNLLYQMVGRGLADIPNSSTGKPVPRIADEPPQRWGNHAWFPAARILVRAARRLRPQRSGNRAEPLSPVGPGQDWDVAFRDKTVIEALCAGVEEIQQNPLFDTRALASALAAYLDGDESVRDALWAVAITGQWHRFLRSVASNHPAVRTVTDCNPAHARNENARALSRQHQRLD
jgi:hypothetical protein